MRESFLGLDVGTTNVKGILVNSDGEILAVSSRPVEVITPQPGWNEQKPEWWWKASLNVIKELSERAGEIGYRIVSISTSGQMHSLVVLDSRGDVLRNAILWNDQRSYRECEEITDEVGGEGEVLRIVGNPMYPGFTLPKLLWIKKMEPDLFEKIRVFLLPKDYVNYRLTGNIFTEVSDASGTAALEYKKLSWANEILDRLGIPREIFPNILSSHEVCCQVSKEVASSTGLSEGVTMVPGGADNACAALGIGVVREREMMISLGTSGTVLVPTKKKAPDPEGRVHFFSHVVPNTFYHMGVMLSAAFSLDWFKDRYLDENLEEINLNVEGISPGSRGIIFLPYLNGERTPHRDPYARASFIGMSSSHSKWEMVRAIFEGVAFGIRDSYEIIKGLSGSPSVIRVVGGGSKSSVWTRILSSVIGRDLEKLLIEEGAAYGAAILAFSGYSGENPIDVSKRWVKIKEVVQPDDSTGIYDEMYRVYVESYRSLKEIFLELSRIQSRYS